MADIKPFAAVCYNREKINNISSLTCPPYDVISEAWQSYYQNRGPYNFIHVLLNKSHVQAGTLFNEWLKEKILIKDTEPAIYFHSQQYKYKGQTKIRLGFIALLKLDEHGEKSTYGHEHTRLEAKEDRFKLTEEVRANLSPIFSIFQDKKRDIQRVFQQQIPQLNPFIEVVDPENTVHKLWRVTDKDILARLQANMAKEDIFIADGHHRYEVACSFRDKMRVELKTSTGLENWNYVLSYFTNTNPAGLLILPIHRLVKPAVKLAAEELSGALEKYFDIEKLDDKNRFFFLMEKYAVSGRILGMYRDNSYWLLRLKGERILDKLFSDKPKALRLLDVSILNTLILKEILKCGSEDKESVKFNQSADELIEAVNSDNSLLAFFLNPAKIQQVIPVALCGYKMPAKSTFFYPKLLSGLVINKF